MKLVLVAVTAIIVAVFFGLPKETFAGGNDTLVIYASGPYLDKVINDDTTSTGQQAHIVYKLVSLDTTYVFLGQISPRENFTVLGVLGSDGRPPCIQPGVLSDGSIPGTLFNLNRKGLTATFRNLYIEGLSTNGSFTEPGYSILASADSVRVYVDNVVFDYVHGSIIGYTANWCDFFVTNCKFRNGVDPATWTDTETFAPVWPSTPALDTLVMKYNTLFCDNGYACAPETPTRYVDFSHNSIVYQFMQPFWMFAVYSAKIDNNILYGTFVAGEMKSEYPWWDEEFSAEPPSIISFDTMNVKSDSVFDPADAGKPNWRVLAEAKRNVEVENNVWFEPKAITDFWTQWDDTAKTSDSLYTPTWMNARTAHMFNDPTDWPGFKASGNMIGTDPGYGSSFANVLQGGGNYGVGLLKYFTLIRTGQSPTIGWGYQIQSIPSSSTNWVPYWPLPEAADMWYTNATVKNGATDGKPLGDPGWFTGGYTGVRNAPRQLPSQFALSNAYPNPLNPSAQIEYSVPKAGFVTLKVYNVLGQEVATLFSGMSQPGKFIATFNGDRYASGVYFYRLESGNVSITKKMVLVK
ncbi:MAG: T9SS type A sorting domain-containing protein [Bacteroidetes bacterium]|nr:T9SS type A sorting domain-containing protein [Bacteroidota bacterium]